MGSDIFPYRHVMMLAYYADNSHTLKKGPAIINVIGKAMP
jgi:hypothetical protein